MVRRGGINGTTIGTCTTNADDWVPAPPWNTSNSNNRNTSSSTTGMEDKNRSMV